MDLISDKKLNEIDNQICDAEQQIWKRLNELDSSNPHLRDSESFVNLKKEIKTHGKAIRSMRSYLHLSGQEKTKSETSLTEDIREEIANQIQRETHDVPVTFRDFVKGLFMWQETPEDRIKKSV